jgi:Tfp pilus assembly protein PilX
MPTPKTSVPEPRSRDAERGSALILALLVAVVLVFLGMGLLLQTSLGLQAAGTDRWVTKALYAADAGAMMQIHMIQQGVISAPGAYTLIDDPALPGLLKGQFAVTVSEFCETQPATPVFANGVPSSFPEYQTRHFHLRSDAIRNIGNLAGLTRAAVEADVAAFPFMEDQFVPVGQCY